MGINSLRHRSAVHLFEVVSISRVVIPRECNDNTTELTLLSWRVFFGTIAGFERAIAVRGAVISTGPLTVVTVLAVNDPLCELPDPPGRVAGL